MDLCDYHGGEYKTIHLWTIICLSPDILSEKERAYNRRYRFISLLGLKGFFVCLTSNKENSALLSSLLSVHTQNALTHKRETGETLYTHKKYQVMRFLSPTTK